MRANRWLAVIGAGLLAVAGSGYAVWSAQQQGQPSSVAVEAAGLPSFAFQDLEGKLRRSEEWAGKVVVVNFWATWCPPCRSEMPIFMDFQTRYQGQGLQIVGIAVDDREQVQDFVDVMRINFPVVIGGDDAIGLSMRLGNRNAALPYTAIFNRQGEMVHAQMGAMSEAALTDRLAPWL